MAVVQFNTDEFRLIFPSFDNAEKLPDLLLEHFFSQSELIVNNSKNSIVKNEKERKILLYTLVAHYCALRAEADNGGGSTGMVSSASEGSTSVSFNTVGATVKNAWFMKTPYGQEFWQLTLPYRSMHYFSNVARPDWEATNGRWRRFR